MTTIAYKDGILAGDTLATGYNNHSYGNKKVFKTKYFLFGFTGTLAYLERSLEWIKKHEKPNVLEFNEIFDKDVFGEETTVLLINKNRKLFLSSDGKPFYQARYKETALGSGGDYAIGAMACGKSAVEAVKVARSLDPRTGGAVTFVSTVDL